MMTELCGQKNQLISRAFSSSIDLKNCQKQIQIKRDPLIKQFLNKDFANLHSSKEDIMSLVLLTHSNITQLEFNKMVNMWIKKAQHPHTQKRFL